MCVIVLPIVGVASIVSAGWPSAIAAAVASWPTAAIATSHDATSQPARSRYAISLSNARQSQLGARPRLRGKRADPVSALV